MIGWESSNKLCSHAFIYIIIIILKCNYDIQKNNEVLQEIVWESRNKLSSHTFLINNT